MPNKNLLFCHVYNCFANAEYVAEINSQSDILLCARHEHELTALVNLVNFLLDDMSLHMLSYNVEEIPIE